MSVEHLREAESLGAQMRADEESLAQQRANKAQTLAEDMRRADMFRSLLQHPGWQEFAAEIEKGRTELLEALATERTLEGVQYIQAQLASIKRILAVPQQALSAGERAARQLAVR